MRASFTVAIAVTIGFLSGNVAAQGTAAGSIVYAHGQASVRDATGSSRPAARGQSILAGETVLTGNGRMQMKMADGGFIQIQPNTQFKVDAYNYSGSEDGSERSFFNLLKGGIRFVTGAIGHRNKDNFRIATTVATIGIRGSAGRADLCIGGSCGVRPNGLYVTGNQDTLLLRNETGEVEITPGETFHTECSSCSIQQVQNPPDAYAAVQSSGSDEGESEDKDESASEESVASNEDGDDTGDGEGDLAEAGGSLEELSAAEFAAGDERNESGEIIVVDGSPPGGGTSPGTTITDKPIGVAYHRELSAGVYSAGVAAWGDNGGTSTYTLGGANNLPVSGSGVNVDGSNPGGTFAFNTAAAAADESGTNAGIGIAWARWSSNWSAVDNGINVNPTGWMHAIYATTQQVVNVPVSGTVTYGNLIGGTSPTIASTSASVSGTLTSMSLQVNFDNNQVSGSMAGNFSTLASFSAGIAGSLGAGGDGGTLSISGTCSGSACSSSPTFAGGAEFGLVGSNADAAVGVYDLKTSDNSYSITGSFLLAP
jgi:hypothetical protein